jgi:hypothetical protein
MQAVSEATFLKKWFKRVFKVVTTVNKIRTQ